MPSPSNLSTPLRPRPGEVDSTANNPPNLEGAHYPIPPRAPPGRLESDELPEPTHTPHTPANATQNLEAELDMDLTGAAGMREGGDEEGSVQSQSEFGALLERYHEEDGHLEFSLANQVSFYANTPEIPASEIEVDPKGKKGSCRVKNDFLSTIRATVEDLQLLFDDMAHLVNPNKRSFQVDPGHIAVPTLGQAQTLGQLQAAWRILRSRFNCTNKFILKYKMEYKSVYLTSPVSTKPDLHDRLESIRDRDIQIRYVHRFFPRHAEELTPNQHSRLRNDANWAEVFRENEGDEDEEEVQELVEMPRPADAGRGKGEEARKRVTFPESSALLGVAAPYRTADQFFQDSAAQSAPPPPKNHHAGGNILRGLGLPSPGLATLGNPPPPAKVPNISDWAASVQNSSTPKASAKPTAGVKTTVKTPSKSWAAQPTTPGLLSSRPGESDDSEEKSPQHPRFAGFGGGSSRRPNRNGDDDSAADADEPSPVYGSYVPTIKPEFKPDQLPKWDGNHDTALQYFWEIQQLAELGGHLPKALGYWLWNGLEKGSTIQLWFSVLGSEMQIYMRSHYLAYLRGIKEGFLGKTWQMKISKDYEVQAFRQRGHENETPAHFIARRIQYTRMLLDSDSGGPLEIYQIWQRAPIPWGAVINIDAIKHTHVLFSKVTEHEKALVHSWKLDANQVVTYDNLERMLAKLGVPLSSASSGGRKPFRRHANLSELADNAEEEEEEEPYPSTFEEDEPVITQAYQVVTKRQRLPPKGGYPFSKNDNVQTKMGRPPPSPCKVCGSDGHWDKECPDWNTYLSMMKKTARLAEVEPNDESEVAYRTAFSVLLNRRVASEVRRTAETPSLPAGFHEAASLALGKILEAEPESCKTGDAPRTSQAFRATVEEVEDEEDTAARTKPKARNGSLIEATEEVHEDPGVERPPPKPGEKGAASTTLPGCARIRLSKARTSAPGFSALGVSVLAAKGRVGCLSNSLIDLRLDSGADVTLVSKEFYDSLPNKPPVKRGMRMKLWQLTDKDSELAGFVRIPIFFTAKGGEILEAEAEAYLVPKMTVPILLGEDFQRTYEMNINRSNELGTDIHFSRTPYVVAASSTDRTLDFDRMRQSAYSVAKFQRNKVHRKNKKRRNQAKERAAKESTLLRAAADCYIRPQQCKTVPLIGDFVGRDSWAVERTLLETEAKGDVPLAVPNALFSSKDPFVQVANPSSKGQWIRKGEIIGIKVDPSQRFDTPTNESQRDSMAAQATALKATIQAVNLSGNTSTDSRAKEQQTDTESENPKTDPSEDEEEDLGPKTAAMPDPKYYPSTDIEELLDVGDLPEHLKERAWNMLKAHQGAFGFDGRLGHHPTRAKVRTKEGVNPISLPMYGSSPAKRQVIDEQLDKWFEQGVIEKSESPWGAPVVIAYRNGKPRFCVDYRKLNAVTISDEFPIPRQSDILAALSGSQVLSSLDALSGFTQMEIDPEDMEKTAFRTHRGLFQFRRMPFGLRNGPSIFQRVMQGILAPFLWLFCLVYIDDIVVYSKTYEEHIEHLGQVLGAIEKAGITLSPVKCHMFYGSILLLGHKVSRLGLSTHKEKVKAILELARPSKLSQLQTLLGMAVYFSAFIPYYADKCVPLFRLLRKGARWDWTEEMETGWIYLKKALQDSPVLGHPMEGRPYRLYTDASDYALGCALQQVQPIKIQDLKGTRTFESLQKAYRRGDAPPKLVTSLSNNIGDDLKATTWEEDFEKTIVYVERVIGYWSRTFRPAETRYSATEREALGAKEGLVRFQPFIEGEKVILVTDHAALQWARTYENSNRRLAAWGMVFSAFAPNLEIVHRAGRKHSNVDPLSRLIRDPPESISPKDEVTRTLSLDVVPESHPFRHAHLSWTQAMNVHAFVNTRSRTGQVGKESDQHKETEPIPEKLVPMDDNAASYERGRTKPSSLLLEVDPETRTSWVEGLQSSASFRGIYSDPSTNLDAWVPGRRFFKDESGLLFFRDADYHPRLCVPESMRLRLLTQAHEGAFESAHEGPEKLWKRLCPQFYWKRMKLDIEKFCRTCDYCQKTKPSNFKKFGMLIPNPIPSQPYLSVSMDFVVNLPWSEGFNSIFVVVDRLTKHANFIPTNTGLTSKEFGRLFAMRVMCRFGVPESIITDRDPRWTSDFWNGSAAALQIKMMISSARNPKHDGQTEVVNKNMEIMLRSYVNADKTNWAEWLPLLEFSYNCSVHSSTGSSPFRLLYGYQPRSSLSSLIPSKVKLPADGDDRTTPQFLARLSMHRDNARRAIALAQDQQARAFNAGRKETPDLDKGDLALVNPHSLEWVESRGLGAKLGPRWIGPFDVLERINPNVFRLRMPDSYPGSPVFNIQHLKKYHKPEESNRSVMPDSTVRKEASEEYEVESIIGHKRAGGEIKYLVRWANYGPQYDDWVSSRDLRNAPLILREYREKHDL